MNSQKNIPHHVAIIMDGNGRWAKLRGLPRVAGHAAGVRSVDRIVEAAAELGVKVLTLYAFSTENRKRPKQEVGALFSLIEEQLRQYEPKLQKNNIRLLAIGDIAGLPRSLRDMLSKVTGATARNTALTMVLALNYGSRAEIAAAARGLAADARAGTVRPEDIDEEAVAGRLYTKGLPDPDLMIRTSGEMRLSNFLLWQLSYAEFYVSKTLWPDFGKADFKKAIEEYRKRQRRFGG